MAKNRLLLKEYQSFFGRLFSFLVIVVMGALSAKTAAAAYSCTKCYTSAGGSTYVRVASSSCPSNSTKASSNTGSSSCGIICKCNSGYSPNAGKTACVAASMTCNAGMYLSGSMCMSCEPTYYCPGGSWIPTSGAQGLYSCGSYYPSSAAKNSSQSNCYVSCSNGRYKSSTTVTGCTSSCAAGTYKSAHSVYYGNTSSCSSCTGATYSGSSAGACTNCPSGYQSGNDDRSSSAKCYGAAKACTTKPTCPTGYTCTYSGTYVEYYSGAIKSGSKTCSMSQTPISYTISFNCGGGSGSQSSTTASYGSSYTFPTSTTCSAPSGYTFYGWSTSAGSTSTSTSATITGNRTLYAVWRKSCTQSNTVSNCYSYNTAPTGYQYYTSSGAGSCDAANRTCRSCRAGYYYSSGSCYACGSNSSSSNGNSTNSCNCNSGYKNSSTGGSTVTNGAACVLACSNQNGCTSAGGNSTSTCYGGYYICVADGAGCYKAGSTCTCPSSGNCTSSDSYTDYDYNYQYDAGSCQRYRTRSRTCTTPCNKNNSGCTYGTYGTTSCGSYGSYGSYGSWSGSCSTATGYTGSCGSCTNVYTLSFNCGGGTGSQASASVTYGSSYTLPSSTTCTAPSGYSFYGWSTSSSSTSTTSSITMNSTSGMTVYAVWRKSCSQSNTITGCSTYNTPTGYQYYTYYNGAGSCSASNRTCSSCSTSYYYSSGSCYACSGVSNTSSTDSCSNGCTPTSCPGGYSCTHGSNTCSGTKTCNGYYTGGAGGTYNSTYCSGCSSYGSCVGSCSCTRSDTACGWGKYSAAGVNTCTNTTAGYYVASTTSSSQSRCPADYRSSTAGEAIQGQAYCYGSFACTKDCTLTSCPAGYSCTHGSSSTSGTEVLNYNGTTKTACNASSSSCTRDDTACGWGKYSAAGVNTCTNTTAGYYVASTTSGTQAQCPAGYRLSTAGQAIEGQKECFGSFTCDTNETCPTGYTCTYNSETYQKRYGTSGNGAIISGTNVCSIKTQTPNDAPLSFDCGGGTGTQETVSVSYGEAYTLPATTTCVAPAGGYTFFGWSATAGNTTTTTSITMDTTVGKTVYAVWRRTNCTQSNTITCCYSYTTPTGTQYYTSAGAGTCAAANRTCASAASGCYLASGTSAPSCTTLASGFYPNSVNGNTGGASACSTDSISGCYVATANAASCTNCGPGKYKVPHTVAYGSTSACSSCPAGQTTTGFGSGADEAGDCGRILHYGADTLILRSVRKTTPSLVVGIDGTPFYGNMTTNSMGTIRLNSSGTNYSVYDDSMM